MSLSRRALLHLGGAMAAGPLFSRAAGAQTPTPGPALSLPSIGRLTPRASRDIAASPISIGFETLDRSMFDPTRAYDHVGELGVKWARVQTGWARTERTKGEFDFAWLDAIVDNLRSRGVQPWFNVGYGNRLYMPDAPNEFAVGWAPVFSDDARAGWVRFVQKLAEHFATRVTHYEIWNEPNITAFWQPRTPSARDYADLVRTTVPHIRQRVPNAFIIVGAITHLPDGLTYLDDFLGDGVAPLADAVSYHPYRAVPEANHDSQLRAMRAIVDRHKPGLPLWQGENGAPSEPNGTGALAALAWTEEAQAKWLLRRLITDLSTDVQVTSYFHTVDMVNYIWNTGQSGKTNFKGVLRGTDYTRKPSYTALQSLCRLFDAKTTRAALAADFQEDKANGVRFATFRRGDEPVIAYWNPGPLPAGAAPSTTRLRTWTGRQEDAASMVLVDLRSGTLHTPAAKPVESTLQFTDLPLLDAPLVITTKAALDI